MNDQYSLFAGGPVGKKPRALKEEILLLKLLLKSGQISQQDIACCAYFGHQASRALIKSRTWPNISFTAKFMDEALEPCQERVISLTISVILRGLTLHLRGDHNRDQLLKALITLLLSHAGAGENEEALIMLAGQVRISLEMRKLDGPLCAFDQCLSHAVHAICGLFEDPGTHMRNQVGKHVAECYKIALKLGYTPDHDIALSVPAFLLYGWNGQGQPLRSG